MDWLLLVAFAPPPKAERAWKKSGYCAVRPEDAKWQRRRNAGDGMRPLRFGVSAEIFGNRRAAAVVKTKSREVVNLAVKKRTGKLVQFHASCKKIFRKVEFSFFTPRLTEETVAEIAGISSLMHE